MKQPKRAITALLLTLLFVAYYGSVTLFAHAHQVNGVTVIHSHPFTSSTHTHSRAAMSTITALSLFYVVAVATGIALTLFRQRATRLVSVLYRPFVQRAVAAVSLRAPPVLQ